MTQRPFLGGGDMTSLPGFGKLTDEEILDMRRRQGLEGFQAQQKGIADLDITGIDFAAMDQDREQVDTFEGITRQQEEAFWMQPQAPDARVVELEEPQYKGPISPFKALSAEAEVAGAILDMTPKVITNAVPILNAMKWGQDFFNYGKPTEETKYILKGMVTGDTGLGIEESIRRLGDIQEERPWHEQIVMGLMSPSSAIGAGPAKNATTFVKAGFKATDNPSIFKQIIESVPSIVSQNAKQADEFEAANRELIDKVMNPEIKIKGLPEGSLFEGDLRLWIDMPADAAIDLSKGSDELASVLKNQDIEDGYQRLENLGLVKRSKTGIISKAVHSGSPEAIEILQNYGRKIGVEGASDGNFFIKSLRPMDEIVSEVVTAENPIIGQLAAKTGINPSLAAKTDVQKAVIAYARQNSSINELVEVALQAGLDSRMLTKGLKIPGIGTASFGGGKSPVNITADGFVEGTDMLWQDVFSMPNLREAFDSTVISDEAFEYIQDYRKIIDEMEKLRVQEGLDPLSKDRDGWFYIPRQAKGKADIDFVGKSKSHLARHEVTATEKLILDEVRYDVDPRATLKTHLQAAYHEILDEQLSGFLSNTDTIRSLTVSEALEAASPKVVKRHDDALKAVAREKAKLKKLTKQLQAELEKTPDAAATTPPPGISKRLWAIEQGTAPFQTAARKKLQAQVDEARASYQKARGEFLKARSARAKALEKTRNASVVPGQIFGDVGTGNIKVEVWRNRMYRAEDVGALRDAVGNLSGDASSFSRNFARVTDAQRYLMANADFGAPFIQGLPLLGRNPFKWSKATLTSFAAFADPAVQGRFVRQNLGGFQEMAQYGVPVGDVEFFAAMEQGRGLPMGKILSFLPTDEGSKFLGMTMSDAALGTARKMETGRAVAKETQQQTLGRFQASYGMFLARARLEMWQGMKGSWTQSGREGNTLAELGAYIRNMTGGLDSKALGVGANQREFESSWVAFSPRLLRSTIALVSDALRFVPAEGMKYAGKGSGATVRQKEAARSLGQLLGGVHLLYATSAIGLGVAKGHGWDRIQNDLMEGMNPLSGGKYLSFEIDGQYFGVGGQVRALTQVLTGITSALAPGGDPVQNLIKMNSRDNPIIRFLANRGAVSQEWAKTVVEGTTDLNALPFDDVEGKKDIAPHLFENSLPFVLQGMMEGDSVPGWLVGATGFRSNPATPADIERKLTQDAFYAMSDAELAEYGIEKGAFPNKNWKRDLPSDLREKIAQENPEIEEARQANIERQLESGSEYPVYKLEKDEARNTRDSNINSAAERLGTGKELRDYISNEYQIHGITSEKIDDNYRELVDNLDDLEATENPYNAALDEYWRVMTDSKDDIDKGNIILLEDPETREFNFAERERRLESLRENPITKPFYDRLIADIRDNPNTPPIVRELQDDREKLREFWDIAETEAEKMGFTEEYEYYLKQSRFNKNQLTKITNENWTTEDRRNLRKLLSKIEDEKTKYRRKNLETDTILWKWGYYDSAVHPKLKYRAIKNLLRDQGGRATDRGQIEDYVNALMAEAVAP
tara:strand:+ start:3653 stop:8275 length:4623 start_codon:yes stop_codon:yes gene_type:complete